MWKKEILHLPEAPVCWNYKQEQGGAQQKRNERKFCIAPGCDDSCTNTDIPTQNTVHT
jgi:hypothetical protein